MFPRSAGPSPREQSGHQNQQTELRLGNAPVKNPEEESRLQVIGGFHGHPKPAEGGLQTHPNEGSETQEPHGRGMGGGAVAAHHEQGYRKGPRERPDAEMHEDHGSGVERFSSESARHREEEGDQQRPAISPNPRAEDRDEQSEGGGKQPMPVLQADGKLPPPAFGI